METTRRNFLLFASGSAAGVLFTPAPWRLITDTALWSENWPGIPKPARGEIRARYTHCSLCPAGCAVRARTVGDQPVALSGVPGHPLSHGALCPFGVAGHQLPYHPARLRKGPVQEAAAAVARSIAKCGPGESVAVLDLRPGRTASWTHRRAMSALPNGMYVAPSRVLGGELAVDLASAKTVLSFGAPLFDGWGTPGNVIREREHFRLIQAEPLESRTAAMSDLWLPIRPGSEDALALAIANVLGDPKATEFMPAKAAAVTGLREEQIVAVAQELAQNGPSLVLDRRESGASLALNALVGALGRTIVTRRETPVPESWKSAAPVTELASVPDGSVRVLLIDESAPGEYLPWSAVVRKLVRDNPVVVAFSWSPMGYARHAEYVLPTAVFPEAAGDVPPAVDSPVAAFQLAAPLVTPPDGMVEPAEFIKQATGWKAGDALRERAAAIHKAGRGTLFTYADAKSVAVKEVKPDDFWKALNQGGCWIDEEWSGAPRPVLRAAAASPGATDLMFTETVGSATLVPPLLSKIYQESNLRQTPNSVAFHPDTARANGLADSSSALLVTPLGRCAIRVTVDSNIPPGLMQVAATPSVLDLCASCEDVKVVAA
ncbi:MAG TPA: hypothetical protein VGZ73_09470 [Bryobacteraceae bacterium]|nr:hypothetical protein [Bryobacteraceae bacterium]